MSYLAKKLSPEQSNAILALKSSRDWHPGSRLSESIPEGALASQVLGFVNNDGNGEYGLEQALNKELAGTPGQVKGSN